MLNTVIVDDEVPARQRLRKLLRPMIEAGRISIEGEAGDGHAALQILNRKSIDLLFLDVKMPEMNGFDVLERIAEDRRPAVVFTTAFDQYALRAFETNAIDYLLKPISTERLEDAVKRSERVRRTTKDRLTDDVRLNQLLEWLDAQSSEGPASKNATEPEGGYLKQISIPYRERILIVPVSRLVAAEINDGITRLHLLDEHPSAGRTKLHPYVVNYTLDQLEATLHPDAFVRVHRSSIVQLEKIREMIPWFSGRYKLVLDGDHEVIASRERSRQLKERLML